MEGGSAAALRSQTHALLLHGVCGGGQLGLLQSSTPFYLLKSMQNIFYLYTPLHDNKRAGTHSHNVFYFVRTVVKQGRSYFSSKVSSTRPQ